MFGGFAEKPYLCIVNLSLTEPKGSQNTVQL